jgi:carbamoyl-phosphate synthase small subunit
MQAYLVLEDGSVFAGESLGATGRATGELVFTTSMTGYQEILTDPSYAGQIVLMTYPLIGNYGVNDESDESRRAQAAGFVVREACETPSNWRARAALHDYLAARGIVAMSGVDTRAVTLRVRYHGVMMATITTDETPDEALHRLQTAPRYDEEDFVYRVTTPEPYKWGYDGMEPIDAPDDRYRKRVVILDCGVKWNIPRRLASLGVRSIILPATATAEQILAYQPDGVLLSPGPGDPARLQPVIATVRALLGKVPDSGHLLGQPVGEFGVGGAHLQAQVRASRGQPPCEKPADGARGHHFAKSRLRRRPRQFGRHRAGADAHQPQRRHGGGRAPSRPARHYAAVSPRSRAGSVGQPPVFPRVPRTDGRARGLRERGAMSQSRETTRRRSRSPLPLTISMCWQLRARRACCPHGAVWLPWCANSLLPARENHTTKSQVMCMWWFWSRAPLSRQDASGGNSSGTAVAACWWYTT